MQIDSSIIQRATQETIKELKDAPEVLTAFIDDIQRGSHKKWNMWQLNLGQILAETFKGRPIPVKKRPSHGKTQMKFGACYLSEKNGVGYTPQLPFHKCKDDKERAKMILASDHTPQLKVDLLSVLRL